MTSRSTSSRRRTAAVGVVLAMVLSTLGYTSFALLAPIDPIAPVVLPVEPVSTPAGTVTLPDDAGVAIAAVEGEQIFAGRELDTPRVLASITKVITALVVLEAYPIGPGEPGASVTLSPADAALPARYRAINGTIAPAPAGTVLTQRQVIELMMVRSANNYAETLALWAFGSIDAYLVEARSWLDAHGLDDITVGDSTGFSLQNTGTPRDLVELARVALQNEVIVDAAAQPSISVPGVGTFETTNRALGLAGVSGIKTGTLDGIGANLLFSSTIAVDEEPVEVVGVVLGLADQEAVAAAVQTLVLTAADDFHVVSLAEPGVPVATYTSAWGDSAQLVVADAPSALVWGASTTRAGVRAPPLVVGREPPDDATLVVQIAGQRQPVSLRWVGTIEPPPLEWRLWQPLEQLIGG